MRFHCRCDGRYDGCEHGELCDQQGGGYRSPYFCADCDRRRIAALTMQFEELRATFSDQSGTTTEEDR